MIFLVIPLKRVFSVLWCDYRALRKQPYREVVNSMDEHDRYIFESFSSEMDHFDGMFTDFVNKKYKDGWKYKNCQYHTEGDKRYAYCLFRRIM